MATPLFISSKLKQHQELNVTPKQKSTLASFGVDVAELGGLSIKDASDLISKVYSERKEASYSALNKARDYPLVDLVGYHKSKWRVYSANNAAGKCPLCNKTDKDDDKSDSFSINLYRNVGLCRLCGWQGGPVEFVMERDGLEWYEAARKIVNEEAVGKEVEWMVREKARGVSAKIEAFDKKWRRVIHYGQGRLFHSPTMAYLARERGIDFETARAFAVGHTDFGYGPWRGEACALFPYYTRDGKLCAVNRRVARHVEHDKSWFAANSTKTAGWFGVGGVSGLVWVVEGEINAMSLFQGLAKLGRLDTVISPSSQDDLVARADEIRGLGDVIVWCDEKETQRKLRLAGIGAAWATRQDANDLLLCDKLESCINWMLERF